MPSPAPGFLCRFMLELKKEQKLVYTRKVTTMAHNIGYTVSNITQDCIATLCLLMDWLCVIAGAYVVRFCIDLILLWMFIFHSQSEIHNSTKLEDLNYLAFSKAITSWLWLSLSFSLPWVENSISIRFTIINFLAQSNTHGIIMHKGR